MQVLLLRHGLTRGNLERRYIGVTDDPLCPEGIAALRASAPARWTGTVYVTPLQRTRQTADILFPLARQTELSGLAEMHFGTFENRNAADMENDPAYRTWVDSMCLALCPGGESQEQFVRRVCAAFTEAVTSHPAGLPFFCVCHGGTIMALLSRLARPHRDYWDWHVSAGCGYLAHWDGCALLNPAPVSPADLQSLFF